MLTDRTMIACVDVDYRADHAVAACVLFRDWLDAAAADEWTQRIAPVAPYQPGQFYRRELPCLLAVLAPRFAEMQTVVVDGYVWLRDERSPGLGAHLYEALGRKVSVIGVAKSCFQSAGAAKPVLRGGSKRPLFVTAAGLDLLTAAACVRRMHGDYRIPTLLRRVDHCCRNGSGETACERPAAG
jgi:deoxyribonuclease V